MDDLIRCAAVPCEQTHKNNRWAKTKAHAAGWFEQRDGRSWCPEHTPPWVAAWRARKGKS